MKKINVKLIAAVAVAVAGTAISGMATVTYLPFSGLAPYPNGNDVLIENYYDGGTDSAGYTGPNYGITFSSNALLLCLNSLSVDCSNTSKGGLGNPESQEGALFWLSGPSTYMNDAGGFSTGFSFTYTDPYTSGASISVWSGLNGTGTELTSLSLPLTPYYACPGYDAGFCPFEPIGVTFSGTAESISFNGTANQVVYDDITFGSSTPGAIPEPGSLSLLGTGLIGLASKLLRRRESHS